MIHENNMDKECLLCQHRDADKTGSHIIPSSFMKRINGDGKRDHEIDQELLFLGWTVIRFWGKDIKKNLEECVQVVEETVFEVKMSWDEYEE